MNEWLAEDLDLEERRQEVAYYARLDAAEDYAAFIERMAESDAGDELVPDWFIVAAADTRTHDAPYDFFETDLEPEPPTPAAPTPTPFNRGQHCRAIASYGGQATLARHGRPHYVAIGKAGARSTIERHGYGYFRGLVEAKGWQGPRRPDLLADLAAGHALAELDLAA